MNDDARIDAITDALVRGTDVAIDMGVIIEAIYFLDAYVEQEVEKLAAERKQRRQPARFRRMENRIRGVELTLASLRAALSKIPDQPTGAKDD